MRGQPIEDYMRNVAFADQIRDFRGAMQEIGRQHGYGIEDVQAALFESVVGSNGFLRSAFSLGSVEVSGSTIRT